MNTLKLVISNTIGRMLVLLFLLFLPFTALAISIDSRELSFKVTVTEGVSNSRTPSTPLSLYEKQLGQHSDGYYVVDAYRSSNRLIPAELGIPTPTILGDKSLYFNFPSVRQESASAPLHLEFFDSIVLIIGKDRRTGEIHEVNISEFTVESMEAIRYLRDALESGQILDQNQIPRKVLGVEIQLSFDQLDAIEIEKKGDSFSLRSENIVLSIEKLSEFNPNSKVISMNEYLEAQKALREPQSESFKLGQLRTACDLIYQR